MVINTEGGNAADTTTKPELIEIGCRLKDCADRFDGLTLALKNKLQYLKLIEVKDPTLREVEKESNCFIDDLNKIVERISDYNNRLEDCYRHLGAIV